MRKQFVVAPIIIVTAFLLSSYVAMTNPLHNRRGAVIPLDAQPRVHNEVSHPGTITGRVLNPEGQTVSQATVVAEPERFISGIMPFCITNKKGRFSIKGLMPGRYKVYASKEEDGYPLPISTFHMGNSVKVQEIAVSEEQATEVVIHLANKVGKLTGRIVDETTAEPVIDARITLRRVDNPNFFLMTAPNERGSFKILVPSDAFTIEISAPNYETKLSSSILVAKGITERLDISLRPIK